MTNLRAEHIKQAVEIGDELMAVNGAIYQVIGIAILDPVEYPNRAKHNIGGTVYLQRGNGKLAYRAALDSEHRIKNGLVGRAGCDTKDIVQAVRMI